MKKEQYRQILIQHMRPSARRLNGNDFIFQKDSDPKHTSHLVKNYLRNQRIEVLSCPPQSPDLNPIENLWSELNRQLNNDRCNTEDQLLKCSLKKWESLSVEYLKKLVERMPRRCAAVLKNHGYPINY